MINSNFDLGYDYMLEQGFVWVRRVPWRLESRDYPYMVAYSSAPFKVIFESHLHHNVNNP